MNPMLQLHGAKQVSLYPPGLRDLVTDISREVLRHQPMNLCSFISNYLGTQLKVRESAKEALAAYKMIEERALLIVHLRKMGLGLEEAMEAATSIQAAYRGYASRRYISNKIRKELLKALNLDEDIADQMATKIQSAYRGYVSRKHFATQIKHDLRHLFGIDEETAHRMATRIQAAYRGYVTRKSNMDEAIAEQMATRIQTAFREYLSRKYFSMQCRHDLIKFFGIDEATADVMATRIQVAYRIYAEKKRLLRGEIPLETGDLTPPP
ncbi:uncharacterized protein LOC134528130 [Bacillus rossius redtenbacheri]|uniref:uncharacterized protein LOC134528130 n=1 Tax=Bacillus rossius redtenbacheri TaxID=93214 RepID=UPI002FDEB5BA